MPPVKNRTGVKKRRQAISLELKARILALNDSGLTKSAIAKQMKLPRTTVLTIIKEKDRINKAIGSAASMTSTTIRNQQGMIPEMEKSLIVWIKDQNQRGVPLNLAIVQKKALELFKTIKEKRRDVVVNQRSNFGASRGWFMRFKKRYSLYNITFQKEAAEVEDETPIEFPTTLWKIIEDESLSPKQIFNVAQTGLFWKRMPKGTYISQEEESLPGLNAAKDPLTVLLGANAEGDFKLKPLLVYHSENPKEFKIQDKDSLPVIWKSNLEACMIQDLFEEWYEQYFMPAVKNYCAENNLPYKAVLLLDDALSHSPHISAICPHIKIVFLPPNTSEIFQPFDLGVIAAFKAHYHKLFFSQAVHANYSNAIDLRTFWEDFNISKCVENIAASWNRVEPSIMKEVWKNVCPQVANQEVKEEFDSSTLINEIIDDTVKIANGLPGILLGNEDIAELLSSHSQEIFNVDLIKLEEQHNLEESVSPTIEMKLEQIVRDDHEQSASSAIEIRQLTSRKLIEAFSHLQAAMGIFASNDPDFERSFHVNSNISAAYKCYRDIYEKNKERTVST